jgi:hypothetical protein
MTEKADQEGTSSRCKGLKVAYRFEVSLGDVIKKRDVNSTPLPQLSRPVSNRIDANVCVLSICQAAL